MNRRARTFAFFFPAESGGWLSALRIGMGLVVVSEAWTLHADWNALFAGTGKGLVSRELFEGLLSTQSPLIPRLGWLVWIGQRFGLTEETALAFAWLLLLGAGVCLIAGFFSRPAAIVAWFLQLAAAKTGGLFTYGADNFITIGLCYLVLAPFPKPWSWDGWKDATGFANPERLGFHRRILQLHLCLIYFFSGLTKCLGAGWWNGENLWRALTSPPFAKLPIEIVGTVIPLLPAIGIVICLLEPSYAFLIWPSWSRRPVLAGICAMHLAIGLLMGMYLFALVMLILNLAAFGVAGSRREIGDAAETAPTTRVSQIARQSGRE